MQRCNLFIEANETTGNCSKNNNKNNAKNNGNPKRISVAKLQV